MKFHHIRISSFSGSPPSTTTRAGPATGGQRQRPGAGRQVGHRGAADGCPADRDVTGVDQHTVLVLALQRQLHRNSRLQHEFGARATACGRSRATTARATNR